MTINPKGQKSTPTTNATRSTQECPVEFAQVAFDLKKRDLEFQSDQIKPTAI